MAQSIENKEYWNFFQISRLLTGVGTTILKTKLELAFSTSSFEDILNRKRHVIFHLMNNTKCCKCLNEDLCGGNIAINKHQWRTMFAATATPCQDDRCSCCFSTVSDVNIDILDFKLSLCLLKCIATLSPDDLNHITLIDTARVTLDNSIIPGKLSDTDFEKLRENVSDAIKALALTCSTIVKEKVEYDIAILFSEQVSSSVEYIETENFYRFVTLIANIGSAALRDKLEDRFHGYTFESILSGHKHDIYHLWKKEKCCQCGPGSSRQKHTPLLEIQWNKLFKFSRPQCSHNCCCCYVVQCNISFKDLDVTLAACLLQNIAGLTSAELKHVTEIRESKNSVNSHIAIAKLTDSDFKTKWTYVRGHIIGLTKTCGRRFASNPQYVRIVEDKIERVKTRVLDTSFVENSIRLLKEMKMDPEWTREVTENTTVVQSLLTEVKDNTNMVRDLKAQGKDTINIIKHEKEVMTEIKNSVKDSQEMIKEVKENTKKTVKKIKQTQTSYENKVCPHLKHLIDQTKSRLEKYKPKYITMKRPEELAFKRLCNEEEKEKDKTEQTMESGNVLILTGEPGTGKTSTGEEMLRRLSQLNEKTSGYIPIILNVPEDLRLVFEYDKRVAVLVDDPFGKSSCDYQKLEQWERYLRDIEVQVDGGKLKIIFCIRKQTLSESEEITQKYDLFHANNIVDLSSKDNKLSNKEKRYLLIKFCRLNDVTICKELEKQNLPEKIIASLTIGYIAGSDPMLGFQQACYLFFTKPEFFIRGVDFFKHASVNLKLEIDKLRGTKPLQYCILAYAMLKGGFIDVSNIDQSMFEKLFEILEAEAKHSRDIIHSVIHDMDKRYLIRISHGKEVFEFKHETILEAILLSFGNNFSQEFLKLGAKKIITGFARSHGYEPEPGEIYVAFSASDHVQLANYLAQQYGMASIAQHPTSNDKMFIPVLLEIIEKYQQKHLYQRSLLVQRSIEKTDDFTALERIDHQNMAVINAVKYKRTNLVIEMLKRYMHQKGRQDKADSSNSQNFQFQILTVSTYIHALNYLFQNGSQNGAEEVMEVVGVSLEPALRLLQHEIKTKLKCTNICWYAAYCEWRFVLLQLHSSLPDTKFDDKYDEPLIDYCSKLGWIDVVETLLTIKNDDLNQKNPHMENTGVRAASRFNY